MVGKFNRGDVVQLRSGGPAMTVSQLPGEHSYVPRSNYCCQWFRGASKEFGTFGEEELQPYVAPGKG